MTHASVVSEGDEQVEISGEGLGKAGGVSVVWFWPLNTAVL